MTVTETRVENLTEQAEKWLSDFEKAIADRDVALFRELFLEQSYWRDIVTFTWTSRQWWGRDKIEADIFDLWEKAGPKGLRLDAHRPAPAITLDSGSPIIEVFFEFNTKVGYAKGLANLVPDETSPWGMRALWFNTVLYALDGVTERPHGKNHDRPAKTGYSPTTPEQTFGENRREKFTFEHSDPEVLVIGGGQSGVCIGARLDRLGVDVLVVEKNERPGDNWRNRYETLALHTPTDMSDFPYIPIPETFPRYLPKDKVGDYIEAYVNLIDLPYWTSSEVQSATFDDTTGKWTVNVRRADGSVRTMHPVHVVMAVGGVGGKPNIPHIDGLEKFKGRVIHSTDFKTGRGYEGKRVLVVGVSTSAHDIALDLYRNHASYVAMAQRSPTTVVDIETANLVYGLYFTDMPQDEADQRFSASYIWPVMKEALKGYVQHVVEPTHHEFLAKLEAAGLRLDQGEEGMGWMGKYLLYAGGYYLNVGASDVIIEGGIKILQFDDFDDFVAEGVRLKDGTIVELDEIVLATGFQNLSKDVEAIFGAKVAERVGEIGGIDPENGEVRNMVTPTGQEHLWFVLGGIADARKATPWLAIQIQANLLGIVPSLVRNPDGSLTEIHRDRV